MGSTKTSAVLMPTIPGQRFACHSCSQCCRDTVVTLTEEDRRRIDAQDWSAQIDRLPYLRVGKEWMLNKIDDGACVFLDQKGLCGIHSRYGERSKPFACRIFPFSVIPGHGGHWRVSLRFDCPAVARSQGRSIVEHTEGVGQLARQFGRPSRDRVAKPEWRRGVPAGPREIETLVERFDQWFGDVRQSWSHRIAGAIRVTEDLAADRSDSSRGRQLDEYLAGAFRRLPGERTCGGVPPATSRQRRMLRELVFAHVDHSSFEELRASRKASLGRRLSGLRVAYAFRRGKGKVRDIKRLPSNVSFADIEAVRASRESVDVTTAMLTRYVRGRLQPHTWYGAGFHDWPVFDGLRGLWLAIAVTAWIARWLSAGDRRSALRFEDVVRAIGIVDLATLQLPARRRVTTHLRVEYLVGDNGLLRLIETYPLGVSEVGAS